MAQTMTERSLTATEKGRHAELLAQTALLANGYTVMEPIAPEAFDIAIKRIGEADTHYIQVKTGSLRDEKRYGGEWVIVKGAKNSGALYTKEEVDYFIAVYRGGVYMFPNSEQTEYWVRPWLLAEKWTELDVGI